MTFESFLSANITDSEQFLGTILKVVENPEEFCNELAQAGGYRDLTEPSVYQAMDVRGEL